TGFVSGKKYAFLFICQDQALISNLFRALLLNEKVKFPAPVEELCQGRLVQSFHSKDFVRIRYGIGVNSIVCNNQCRDVLRYLIKVGTYDRMMSSKESLYAIMLKY